MPRAIEQRAWIEVCTDPLRRCYNGVWFSSEWMWTEWSILEQDFPGFKPITEERLTFWQELNDYAVSQRGQSAKKEFRIVELPETVDDPTPTPS